MTVAAGQAFRVIDVEGKQVADLFAFNAADVGEYHSAMHTRAVVSHLFPKVGEAFVTNRRRPILTLEADDTPAVHDMLIAPCDPERYQGLGVEEWHASCRENLELAMRELGHDRICIPASINLFMNIPVAADGSLGWDPAVTAAGRLDHAARRDGRDRGGVGLPSGHRPDQRPQPNALSRSSCSARTSPRTRATSARGRGPRPRARRRCSRLPSEPGTPGCTPPPAR